MDLRGNAVISGDGKLYPLGDVGRMVPDSFQIFS